MTSGTNGSNELNEAITKAQAFELLGLALELLAQKSPSCVSCVHYLAQIGRLLVRHDELEHAQTLYQKLAWHAMALNRPLVALSAIVQLIDLGVSARNLVEKLVSKYGLGSAAVTPGSTPRVISCTVAHGFNPLDEQTRPPELVQLALKGCAGPMAAEADLDATVGFSPVFILSDLAEEELLEVVGELEVQDLAAGQVLVEAGQRCPGIWWIEQGHFWVTEADERTHVVEGVHLILGLESLYHHDSEVTITSQNACEALFLPVDEFARLAQASPALGLVFQRCFNRFLIHRAVSRCSLFTTLASKDQEAILKLASGHHIAREATIVTQGEPSDGLYLLVRGEVLLQAGPGPPSVPVRLLVCGDVVGLVGMGKGEQSPLSAVTQSDVLALFVAHQKLEQLVQAHPAIGVALEHLRQGEATLVQQAISRSLTSQGPV